MLFTYTFYNVHAVRARDVIFTFYKTVNDFVTYIPITYRPDSCLRVLYTYFMQLYMYCTHTIHTVYPMPDVHADSSHSKLIVFTQINTAFTLAHFYISLSLRFRIRATIMFYLYTYIYLCQSEKMKTIMYVQYIVQHCTTIRKYIDVKTSQRLVHASYVFIYYYYSIMYYMCWPISHMCVFMLDVRAMWRHEMCALENLHTASESFLCVELLLLHRQLLFLIRYL